MEPINPLHIEIPNHVEPENTAGIAGNMDELTSQVDEIQAKVEKLEKSVNEVEQFYSAGAHPSKGSSIVKDKDKEKHASHSKQPQASQQQQQQPQQQDELPRATAAGRRMQELMRQFATILRQISQHKWAWPFMDPVDVEGLGLHDYYEVIEKPMDFSTIKAKMEAKEGDMYKNVREIYADVRLVFKNAMKYNDEKDDVHVMAKTLLEKFEEKWLQLLPKVAEEEKRQEEEEAKAQIDMQICQEVTYANMVTQTRDELYNLDAYLRDLKDVLVQRCRRMSTDDKRKLGDALTGLSPEDLSKALEIVAENNPHFQATSQEVDLDMDAQSEYTLWRLKLFVTETLKAQGNNASNNVAANNGTNNGNGNGTNNGNDDNKKNNSKRRREICDALAKTAVKRTKKISNM